MQYSPPWWLKNGHIQSIYPSLFRQLDDSFLQRIRLETPDDDFLDIDVGKQGNDRVVIVSHGLEGNSRRPYCLGMMKAALNHSWDVVAWNFRSCSGEPNNKLASYHSGQTQDLAQVVHWAVEQGYREISLVGFSIGGNKTLLYLGSDSIVKPKQIIGAVVFSVPVDLRSSAYHLAKAKNKVYMKNFLVSFKEKLGIKSKLYPGQIDIDLFKSVKNFLHLDELFTAPMNGFSSAEEYWRESSSRFKLPGISVPTLLVSAQDDPFLTPECFPRDIVAANSYLSLETPKYGGHVGFMSVNKENRYWSESRAMAFFNKHSRAAEKK